MDKVLEIGETIMKTMKKHVGVGKMKVFATDASYSRIIGLQASKSTLKRHRQVETLHTDQDNALTLSAVMDQP